MINSYTALDIETTGLNPAEDKIIEIGMAKIIDGEVVETYSKLINPSISLSFRIQELTGINDSMLVGMPAINDIIDEIVDFTEGLPILGHNIIFDFSFIKKAAVNNKLIFDREGIDTLKMARRILPEAKHRTLEYLCKYFEIDPGNSHRALDDALSAKSLYEKLYEVNSNDSGFEQAVQMIYNVKKDTPITPAQISYLTALIRKHNISITEQVELLTKSRASKMIDGIISEFGK